MQDNLNVKEIPKVIHYCWFGGNPIPDEYKHYMDTWRKFCPDYDIKEWNESNFDVNQNDYCKEAYEAGMWAFVSDYARVKIIYEYGGIYLDTDVEIIKPLDNLVNVGCGFIGFQNVEEVTTGLGFAAAPKNECIRTLLEIYGNRHFIKEDGEWEQTPCPVLNTIALMSCGLKTGKRYCKEIQELDGIKVYPIDFFNPINNNKYVVNITLNTYTIHHYSASWCGKHQKFKRVIKRFIPVFFYQKWEEHVSRKDIRHIKQLL